jgi:iron(III) transport system substrate-binding protein
MRFFGLVAAMLFTFSPLVWGQSKPKTVDEIAAYMGPDREQILLEGAKKEGKLVWYTSLAGKSYKNIASEFQKKYPDVKLQVYRAGSKDLAPKILSEAQAGQHLADAIESTPPILMLLRDMKLLRGYNSPELKRYPDTAKTEAKGESIYWVNDRESFIGFGYNTKLIAENDVPKNFDDLLKPALKGKLSMSITSTGDRVIGTMLKYRGKEYIEKLKAQDIKLTTLSGAAQRDLVIAGEFAASPTLFRNHVLVKIDEGAPIKWVPMDVVPTNAGGAAFINHAPHPHAALLFLDFLIGDGGQNVLLKLHYGAAWKDYPFKRYYPERGMTTKEYQKAQKSWNKLLRAVGRGQG